MWALSMRSEWQRASSLLRAQGKLAFLFLVFSFLLLALGIARQHLAVSAGSIAVAERKPEPLSLPFYRTFMGEATISAEVVFPLWHKPVLKIIPDEHLLSMSMNGREVSLAGISEAARKDWNNGFVIDLSDYAHAGQNSLSFKLKNANGVGGVRLENVDTGISAGVSWALLFGGGALSFWVLSGIFGLTLAQRVIALASIGAICLYWLKTPFNVRQFDLFEAGGHLDYIRYLYEHWRLPPPGGGWEYHQPPLYYLTAVPTLVLSKALPALGWEGLLRALSLGYWMMFLCSALAIVRHYLRANSWAVWLASFAICFWPSGIIHSIRVGNDVSFYAWYALSLYATVLWWSKGERRHFVWACVFMALAALTKSNGLAMLGVLSVLWALRYFRARLGKVAENMRGLRVDALALGVSGLFVLGVSFSAKLWMYWRGETKDWLLSNVSSSINPGLSVRNQWFNYLDFDIQKLVAQPWMNAWQDETGRQFFWNYLLRSSLTSEFSFPTGELRTLAIFAGLLLLLLIFHVARRSYLSFDKAISARRLMAWRGIYRALPLVLSAFFLLALLVAYRVKVPMSCNTDFRYIYPMLITIVIGELGLQRLHGRNVRPLYVAAPLIAVSGAALAFWL
ncbi:MAG: hypothetical protein QM776_11145 [Rhodocyclaceae bacterium]